MRFCKYCGSQVPDDIEQCPRCEKYLGAKNLTADNPSTQNASVQKVSVKEKVLAILRNKYVVAVVAVVLIVLIVVYLINLGKCEASGCKNKAISDMNYCYTHKCAVTSCNSRKKYSSNYCYIHSTLYDESSSKVSSYELAISNIKLTSSYGYTRAEGTIKNNSDQTVSYVKIKGSFKDKSGTVLDTDWTYAVGSEGLAPGESCTWSMSIKKNSSVKECSVSILDYN